MADHLMGRLLDGRQPFDLVTHFSSTSLALVIRVSSAGLFSEHGSFDPWIMAPIERTAGPTQRVGGRADPVECEPVAADDARPTAGTAPSATSSFVDRSRGGPSTEDAEHPFLDTCPSARSYQPHAAELRMFLAGGLQ
jgi:hypothetical protein